MKVTVTQHPKFTDSIRVIRISRPSAVHPIKRVNSRRVRSVDSWLSNAPSIDEPEVQDTPKSVITQSSIINTTQENHIYCRRCLVLGAVIMFIIIICSIVGIVLGIKLQQSPVTTNNADMTS